MDSVNKTLYIPLYGKAYVSQKGILLQDRKAEEIWAAEGFPLKGKAASKYLAYYMGMRSAVFDRWLAEQLEATPEAVVLHIGCGLDSRCLRVGHEPQAWFDVDFPEVIGERKRYYQKTEQYKMLPADVRDPDWLEGLPGNRAIVLMEGVSMYLTREELEALLAGLAQRFEEVRLLMDCYSEFAAKASRFRNPINDVGVTKVYGLDDPKTLACSGMKLIREHEMTPRDMIEELNGIERLIFRKLYAGGMAKKLYLLYEYRKEEGADKA